jgi:hypothetical protein
MRGDQLARQRRIIRAIGTSPSRLALNEIAQRQETGIRTTYRDLEALQAADFPLYIERIDRSNRWALNTAFKLKIPAPFNLGELISTYSYKDLVRKALVEPLTQYPMIRRAVALIRESRLYDPGHP